MNCNECPNRFVAEFDRCGLYIPEANLCKIKAQQYQENKLDHVFEVLCRVDGKCDVKKEPGR